MRIAIDITPLKTEHKYRGIGFYTKNLVWALKKYSPENEYIFFTRSENLPKNADLVHYPYFDCFTRTLSLLKKLPTVVTIHDLIPIVFPNHFPRGIKGEIKWQIQRLALKNVSAVITDSKNSKEDIIRITGFPSEKIHVVSLSASNDFKLIKESKVVRTTLLKYNLPEKFILYVGDVNWNKNIVGMLKAFHKLKTQNSIRQLADKTIPNQNKFGSRQATKNLKLVLVGKAFKDETLKETRGILQLSESLKCRKDILRLGFVPTEDLVKIYNLASVYVQPSFYEGFGLPVLEAMACGAPVVAADIPVLKEIAGEAAIYVDPNNIDSIALGIKQALELSGSNHLTLVKKGLKQAKKFNWRKIAGETVKVYKKVREH